MGKSLVFLQGGLGNQMFQYAFYLSLKLKNRLQIVECDSSILNVSKQHNGYELTKVFDISDITNRKGGYLTRMLIKYCNTKCFFIKNIFSNIISVGGLSIIEDTIPSIYMPQNMKIVNEACFYIGYWQTEKYFDSIENIIRSTFRFDRQKLLSKSAKILDHMQRENSVSIHVRRGDYLTPYNERMYGNICTVDYYQKAIAFLNERIPNIKFYVFSNDMDWVKQNLSIFPVEYVDFCVGPNSWQDMFLMSNCKHNIIANSSFSWWGAWLNLNPDKIVISPSKFINMELKGDIIPANWLTF